MDPQQPKRDPWAGIDTGLGTTSAAPKPDPWAGVDTGLADVPAGDLGATFTVNGKPAPRGWLGTAGDIAGDVATGVAKGVGQSVIGAGQLVHMIPGVSRAVDAMYGTPGISRQSFSEANTALEPTNMAQRVGKMGEQIAEVVVPGRAIGAAATKASAALAPRLAPFVGRTAANLIPRAAVEAASGAGLSAVQGGDPLAGGIVGGAVPVVGQLAKAAAPGLKGAAEKLVFQALDPRKERYKAMTEKIAPEILKRGLGGSREAIAAQAGEMASTVGRKIDDAITQFGARQVGTAPVMDALETAKDAFRVTRQMTAAELAANPRFAKQATQVAPDLFDVSVVIDKRPISQLSALQQTIQDLGQDARVDQLVAVRRAWDKVVAQTGGYAQRAGGAIGVPLKDQSEAWAKREGAGAIRTLLDANVPELTVVNKEYSFWKSLDDITTQTLRRTQPHGPGLGSLAAESAGQVVGGVLGTTAGPAGAVGGALMLGKLSVMAKKVFSSPRWKFIEANMKDDLANAIMSGKMSAVTTQLGRISAVEGSKIGR